LVVIVARSPWGVERRYPQLPPEIAERERRVAYIRTVSDELGRAIASQDAIETSRVILNLPLPRAQDVTVSPDAKASVVVTFGEGYGEADADIDAVVALVANAVSGLTVERIVVADSSGQILAGAVQ
jgi:flagellar M-ring protein FliF